MASASTSQVGTAPLPTPDAIRGWDFSQVAQWASKIDGITSTHVDILFNNEITGADLLDSVTKDDLFKVGMPLGPAGRIMSAVAVIKLPASTGIAASSAVVAGECYSALSAGGVK